MTTTSERLLDLLAERGVDTVFGIPGNHTVALYRGFESRGIRHVTCRHEQGAAFMADGYARATGRPGVCILISGPGLLNAATGIAQARADSIPLLIVTGVAPVADLGMDRGTLHELPDQQASAASFCRSSHTLLDPSNLTTLIDEAFGAFTTLRPGPAHIEIPLDLMEAPCPARTGASLPDLSPPGPDPSAIARAAGRLRDATSPAIVVGGGAIGATDDLVRLAERLQAPVFNTVNGKGICPAGHSLSVGGSPSLGCVRKALAEADVVLAIGTEMGETDYDLLMLGPAPGHESLIRIDIDPGQLLRPSAPAIGIASDATSAVRALLDVLGGGEQSDRGARQAAALRTAIETETHFHPEMQAFFDALKQASPEATLVGDSTRPTYYAAWQLECSRPRSYFHSVTGFGTLGYALPAAFGAALAYEHPVIALLGDGGIQFTLPELTTGAELGLPVAVIVWHNDGYREIENSMQARNIPIDSTRIIAPGFEDAARAHHAAYARADTLAALQSAIAAAHGADRPTLIEVHETDFLTQSSGGWYQ
jgi:acetolactate synthase-1/2/3 large subunit